MNKRLVLRLLGLPVLLVSTNATARPVEPSYPCYMIDWAGRVINLAGMCRSEQQPASFSPATTTATRNNQSPLVVENEKFTEVFDRYEKKQYVKLTGEIVNSSSQSVDVDRLNVSVSVIGQVKVQGSTKIDRTVTPGGKIEFEVYFPQSEVGSVSMSALTLSNYSFN